MSHSNPYQYSRSQLETSILETARTLKTPEKWAQTIASRTADSVDAWIEGRGIVTESDIRRIAARKLRELSPDIAFVYQNYDNII